MRLHLSTFGGTVPRADPRLLNDTQAQTAENCNLRRGILQALYGVRLRDYVSSNNPSGLAPDDVNALYLYDATPYQRILGSAKYHYVSTSTTFQNNRASFVQAPLANNTTKRLIWTGMGWDNVVTETGPNDYSKPGEPTFMDVYAEGYREYPNTDYAYWASWPACWWKLKLPRPDAAPSVYLTAGTPSDPENVEDRTYVYTFVRTWNGIEEESAPSDPSNAISVTPGDGVMVEFNATAPPTELNYSSWYPPGGVTYWYEMLSMRVYRTVTSVSGTDYQYVMDITGTELNTSVEKEETVAPEALGDVITTTYFAEPDDALQGLTAMPNGILAGHVRNEVHFCEPYQAHAWPVSYRLSFDHDVVSLGATGNTLVVTTNGNPFLVTGVHPAAMAVTKLELSHACVSWRSTVDMGTTLLYASGDGLVAVSSGQASLISQNLFTRDDWQALNPESMHAVYWEDRYICWYDATDRGGVKGGFILDPKNPESSLTWLSDYYYAAYNDTGADTLFVTTPDPNGYAWPVYEWNIKDTGLWDANLFPTPGFASLAALDAYSAGVTAGNPISLSVGTGTEYLEFRRTSSKAQFESTHTYRVDVIVDANTSTADGFIRLYGGLANPSSTSAAAVANSVGVIPAGTTGTFSAYVPYEYCAGWTGLSYGDGAPVPAYTPHNAEGSIYVRLGVDSGTGTISVSDIEVYEVTPSAPLTYTWKSKVFQVDQPLNMAAAQIFGEHTTTTPLTFNLYADGVLRYTKSVTDDRPFRLPGGYTAETFEVEFIGTTDVTDFFMATTMRELATV